jgi:hypothetical protein
MTDLHQFTAVVLLVVLAATVVTVAIYAAGEARALLWPAPPAPDDPPSTPPAPTGTGAQLMVGPWPAPDAASITGCWATVWSDRATDYIDCGQAPTGIEGLCRPHAEIHAEVAGA